MMTAKVSGVTHVTAEATHAVERQLHMSTNTMSWTLDWLELDTQGELFSGTFKVDSYNWRLCASVTHNAAGGEEYLSLFLVTVESFSSPCSIPEDPVAEFTFTLVNHNNESRSLRACSKHAFSARETTSGSDTFLSLDDLHNGYIDKEGKLEITCNVKILQGLARVMVIISERQEAEREMFMRNHYISLQALNKSQETECLAAMHDLDPSTLPLLHRIYHEAPDDVFELILLQFSEVEENGHRQFFGQGGLNVFRLVSNRCMRAVESVATMLTKEEEDDNKYYPLPHAVLKRCSRIERMTVYGGCEIEGYPKGLKSLYVDNADSGLVESLEHLSACEDLESLDIDFAPYISDLSPLSSCKKLKRLLLPHACVTDLSPLSSMAHLEYICIAISELVDISPLSDCKRLKRIDLSDDSRGRLEGPDQGPHLGVEDLSPLSQLPDLEELRLGVFSGLYFVKDLSFFKNGFEKLKILRMYDLSVKDLGPLSHLPNLQELDIRCLPLIQDISPLSQCIALKKLNVSDVKGIKDLSPLCRLPDLEDLNISWLPRIKDLSLFEKGLSNLRVLDIGCLQVADMGPLTRLQNLEHLQCNGIPTNASLLPLARCHRLQNVDCSTNARDLDLLRESRPDLKLLLRNVCS